MRRCRYARGVTAANDTLTREDALTYLRRFPDRGVPGFAFDLALVLASNGVVAWLLAHGRLAPAHLVALVAAEAALLVAIAALAARAVPVRDWSEPPKPWRERWPVLVFALCWLGFAYALTVTLIGGWPDLLALRRPGAWREAGLHWPLAATMLLALVHAYGDLAHYRRHGAPYLSTTSHDALARWMTLLFGAIPFAVPFFVVAIGGIKLVERVLKRLRVEPGPSMLTAALMIGCGYAGFAVIGWLASSGVSGWAIGYVLAKTLSEAAVAAIPLVMRQVANEPPAASAVLR